MNSLIIAGIIFACAFGGALVGMVLQRVLPESHLRAESRDVIRLGTGLIATMAALVLGLLVGAAKASYDAQTAGFRQLATNLILLDRSLARYGPETGHARELLRHLVASTIATVWAEDGSRHPTLADERISADGRDFYEAIRDLKPQDETQRSALSQALDTGTELTRTRWTLSQQEEGTLPKPFLAVLAFWLAVLFASFGLFSPRNATVLTVLLVCAVSVAGAVFLIVDLDQPFEGLLQVSSVPLRTALSQLGG